MEAPTNAPASRPASWKPILVIAGLLTLIFTLATGQDHNWDLRNYHLYTASALMQGRYDSDIAVAQLQTWHNPTVDFPFAWLVQVGAPGWLVTVWLAVPACFALVFALRIMDLLWPDGSSPWRTGWATVVALTGAAVGPTLGSTFNDAFVAAGALAALYWVIGSHAQRGALSVWIPAGLMAGAAAGLKLTGGIYCIGLAAAMVVAGPLRSLPQRTLALAAGGVTGVLITAGPWAWMMWQAHGNPLFPYFNQIFRSADGLPLSYSDAKFIPHGIDALLVPVHLLSSSNRYSESKLADPRVLLGLAAFAMAWFETRQRAAHPDAAATPRTGKRMLVAFALASFVCWVLIYGIYRYLFAFELLCSVAICAMVWKVWPARWPRGLLAVAAVLIIAVTDRPSWGRDHVFTTPMVKVRFPALPEDALVVLSSIHPLGHAVPYLPRKVQAVAIANNFMDPQHCTHLQQRAKRTIRSHSGPVFLLMELDQDHTDPFADRYQRYGLQIDGQCSKVEDSLRPGKLQICPLKRVAMPASACDAAGTGA